jgi:hypothetical protein
VLGKIRESLGKCGVIELLSGLIGGAVFGVAVVVVTILVVGAVARCFRICFRFGWAPIDGGFGRRLRFRLASVRFASLVV